jgi:hypothetical protein
MLYTLDPKNKFPSVIIGLLLSFLLFITVTLVILTKTGVNQVIDMVESEKEDCQCDCNC